MNILSDKKVKEDIRLVVYMKCYAEYAKYIGFIFHSFFFNFRHSVYITFNQTIKDEHATTL